MCLYIQFLPKQYIDLQDMANGTNIEILICLCLVMNIISFTPLCTPVNRSLRTVNSQMRPKSSKIGRRSFSSKFRGIWPTNNLIASWSFMGMVWGAHETPLDLLTTWETWLPVGCCVSGPLTSCVAAMFVILDARDAKKEEKICRVRARVWCVCFVCRVQWSSSPRCVCADDQTTLHKYTQGEKNIYKFNLHSSGTVMLQKKWKCSNLKCLAGWGFTVLRRSTNKSHCHRYIKRLQKNTRTHTTPAHDTN